MKRAFFLDRDGTINLDRVYIHDPDLIELIPGVDRAFQRMREAGFLVVVVTNQSGIGRGLIAPDAMPKIHARLDELLHAAAGSAVDYYAICPHRPEAACSCRKPAPLLVQEAAKKLDIDIKRSFFVGDKMSDVECGLNAGCEASILVRTGKGAETERLYQINPNTSAKRPHQTVDNLEAAVSWALSEFP